MSKNIIKILGLVAIILLMISCQVLKSKKSISSDSTSVKKEVLAITDTSKGGSVKTNTTKEEFDWYKMTQLFDQNKAKPGDTKVYPSTVIYEGGKGSKESTTIDSSWFKNALAIMQAKVDSTNKKYEEDQKNKSSESKGLGLWLIAICFGVYWLLTKGISFLTSKYTFFIPKNKTS